MRAVFRTADGKTAALSQLTQWELLRTDGSSADSFRLQAALEPQTAQSIARAAEAELWDGDTLRLRALVDEVELQAGPEGHTLLATGRGMAARLMDNEVAGTQFYSVGLPDILARYVTPYGVSVRQQGSLGRLSLFSVPTGATCWQALCGFCLHAGDVRPRFAADGTLLLGVPGAARSLQQKVLAAARRVCRYGVRSQQQVYDLTYGGVRTAENAGFLALGGRSCGVATRSGPYLRATERTAAQRLRQTARLLETAEVTLSGGFAAEPCDRVRLALPQWGLEGDYFVYEVRTRCDAAGLRCTLTLGKEE